jgi:hypothetical protein
VIGISPLAVSASGSRPFQANPSQSPGKRVWTTVPIPKVPPSGGSGPLPPTGLCVWRQFVTEPMRSRSAGGNLASGPPGRGGTQAHPARQSDKRTIVPVGKSPVLVSDRPSALARCLSFYARCSQPLTFSGSHKFGWLPRSRTAPSERGSKRRGRQDRRGE